MQTISRLFGALTGEIHHRPILGLLALLVILLHFALVLLLLQPTDKDNPLKPLKIMEVALVTPSKEEAAPPAPPKPTPPKPPVPPKKKEPKPPVKKKTPPLPKPLELPKLKPEKVGAEEIVLPAPPTLPVQKPTVPTTQFASASKPAAKPGSGTASAKGASTGVIELGCPKPSYPMRAMSRHIEGWVKVELTISTAGTVTNATVLSSEPAGIFDEAALAATRKCKFKPKIVDGAAVPQRAVKKSTFKLTS